MVYFYNWIFRKAIGWKSLLEMRNIWFRKYGGDTLFLNDFLSFAHLFTYGCKGYFLNEVWLKDIDCVARKNWPRADIRYLIGYKDDNIRRFWVPNSEAKRTGYIVIETQNIQVDETVFYTPKPLQLPQPQPDIVEINSDDNSDTESIVSIPSTADPQARNDLYDSKEEVDPFAEDPLADRPESPTDKNVYTASE